MANLDLKIHPVTFGKKEKENTWTSSRSKIIEKIIQNIFFELNSSNKYFGCIKTLNLNGRC